MSHRSRLASIAFVGAMMVSSSAFAQRSNAVRSPWSFSLDIAPVWQLSESTEAFSRGDVSEPTVGFTFGRDLAHFGPWITLAAEVSWQMQNSRDRLRMAFDAGLVTHHLHAAAVLRVELTSWITPYARLSGGAGYLDVSLDDGANRRLSGGAWAPSGSVGVGVLLTSGTWFEGIGWRRGRVALGIEGGYRLVAAREITVAEPRPADPDDAEDRIATQGVSLGTLNTSAVYMRVSIGLRF